MLRLLFHASRSCGGLNHTGGSKPGVPATAVTKVTPVGQVFGSLGGVCQVGTMPACRLDENVKRLLS